MTSSLLILLAAFERERRAGSKNIYFFITFAQLYEIFVTKLRLYSNKNFVKSYNNSEAVYYKKQLSSKGSSITLITKYFSFPSKAEKFEDGYSAYGAALQLAQEPAQRSHVLTAMATIAFKFQVCCKYKY